jgi:hypothetical protein
VTHAARTSDRPVGTPCPNLRTDSGSSDATDRDRCLTHAARTSDRPVGPRARIFEPIRVRATDRERCLTRRSNERPSGGTRSRRSSLPPRPNLRIDAVAIASARDAAARPGKRRAPSARLPQYRARATDRGDRCLDTRRTEQGPQVHLIGVSKTLHLAMSRGARPSGHTNTGGVARRFPLSRARAARSGSVFRTLRSAEARGRGERSTNPA